MGASLVSGLESVEGAIIASGLESGGRLTERVESRKVEGGFQNLQEKK